ncbi:MAG: FAD:protein FMN transferase [Rhodospirillales bacterium]|nr:FAD:protein FMN transferase [Rhodospirillales bacterium]
MHSGTGCTQEGTADRAGTRMINQPFTRRRVLQLVAAGAASWITPAALADGPMVRWRGRALGAEATLTIRDGDGKRARTAIIESVAEIRRIERIFSLHREDSALSSLNATGVLDDPPADLVDVLMVAAHISEISGGAFDVTVQPLWKAYVLGQRTPAKLEAALERARTLVDWRRLRIGRHRLAFADPGMVATLNGIAQGYATDRVAERMREHGFSHVLVNVGEYRGLGERADGRPWRIGVGLPDGRELAGALTLSDRAVATSSPLSTTFDADGKRHHLFDPRTGRSAQSWINVSVVADTAMGADALSTAIAVAPKEAAQTILTAGDAHAAILIDADGRQVRYGA